MVFTIAMLPIFLLQDYFYKYFGVNIEMRFFLKVFIIGFLFFSRYQLYEAKGNYGLMAKILVQMALVHILYNQGIARIIVYFQG